MGVQGLKRKKVSKKLKSSWRKHVNVNDVEEFLEEQRLEERLGPLELLPNEALFKVDSQPSIDLLSSKERRKLKASKPLKCFSALEAYTNVPDPISKRNRVRTKDERRNELVKKKEEQNKLKGIFKHKTVQANLNRKLDDIRRKNRPKRGEFYVDLWNENVNKEIGAEQQWVESNTKNHNLRGVSVSVKKLRKSDKHTKNAPAIEPPHPGMSYNPSFEDHQDLLRKVAEKEQKLIKHEKHLQRVTTGMFSKVSGSTRDKDWLIDMSQGIPSKANPQSEEDSETEFKSVNPPVKNVKKSLKQKRKRKEQLEIQKARRAKKLEKKKITDIHQLKGLVKHINTSEVKQSKQRDIRKKNKEINTKPTVLNANKYEEPDLEFHMGQEISGNLKDLKIEGNLLSDRFKSMQKRNILAPTKKYSHKKGKVKKYTKPGHKDADWKKTVARTLQI